MSVIDERMHMQATIEGPLSMVINAEFTHLTWQLVVRNVLTPVTVRYNGATQYIRNGMVVQTVQGKPWEDIHKDGAAAARWVQQCKQRPLLLGFAVAEDGGPLVVARRGVQEGTSINKKPIAGGNVIIAQAQQAGFQCFQVKKGGKNIQLIITSLGLQMVVEKKKRDTHMYPYENLVSAKPYRVEKKRGIMITMVDGGKNFYEAVEADEIALAVMIKQHELEVAKQALKRAQTKKHTGLTDSDESSQSESDSDTSSAGSEENNDSSDDEHHADTDNGDVVTALQRQLESSRDKLVNAEARVLELERSRRALQKATFDLEMKVDEAEAKLDDAVKKQEVAAVEMATEKQRREHCEAQLGERTKEIKELRKQIAAAVSPALDNDGQGLLQAEREKRTECEQEARQLSRRLKDVEEQLAAVTEQHSQQAESLTAQRSASMGHGSAVVEMKMARPEQADRIAPVEAQLEAQREELKQTPAANTNGSAKCSQPTKMAKAGGLAGHMPYVPHGARRQRRASEVAVNSLMELQRTIMQAKQLEASGENQQAMDLYEGAVKMSMSHLKAHPADKNKLKPILTGMMARGKKLKNELEEEAAATAQPDV